MDGGITDHNFMSDRAHNLVKNSSTDRILVLGKLNAELPISGMMDFTNTLHAVMDTQTTMWYMKYDHGILPEVLKQRFTSWSKLMGFVTEYFKRRNIKIEKVID